MVGSGKLWQMAICPVANAISRIEDMLSVRLVTFHILNAARFLTSLAFDAIFRRRRITELVSSSHAGTHRDAKSSRPASGSTDV